MRQRLFILLQSAIIVAARFDIGYFLKRYFDFEIMYRQDKEILNEVI